MNDSKVSWKDKLRYKLKATSIHLLLSLLIFAVFSYFIFYIWYPGALFTAEGGLTGITLMAAVDLVLGPSLTFVIFNHTKPVKEIIFDLTVIAMVQIGALTWGGLQVYSQRPVALVMWEGVFYTVTEDYYKEQGASLDDVAVFSNDRPMIIYADTDHSISQLTEMRKLNDKEIPPYAQVHLYKPVKDSLDNMLRYQVSNIFLMGLGEDYIAENNEYVFNGTAKHRKLYIYLDSEANFVTVRALESSE